MKSTKLTSALLLSSLFAGGATAFTAGITTAVKADAVSSQPWNQPENTSAADPNGNKSGVTNEANDHVVTPDMTEIKTNSQSITRTIRFDYSGVEQYLKPGVDYPKEKTQTVIVMQQGVKGTNGQLNWGQWSVGTFPKIELSALSGINATTKLVPVNASGATITDVPQQDVKHGDQNTTVTIKFKAIDTSKNDANQTHTDADRTTITSHTAPIAPVVPARPAVIQSDPATTPAGSQSSSSSSSSLSSSSHSNSAPEKPSAAKPKPSASSSANHASSDKTDKTDKDPSTDGNGTPSKVSGTQANDNSQSKDGKSDGQTSNGLPVQNNGTSKTQSKTEQQPNSGNLPQTGDQSAPEKAASLMLTGLAMMGSAVFLKLKQLF